MAKIMTVELSGKGNAYATAALPLTPYEMLDTLDKLRLTPREEPEWEILEYETHFELRDWIGSGSVYELNALCEKLSELNEMESVAFEGLVEMEKNKELKIIPMHRLLDLAFSTDQCHLLDEVHSPEQLGRFAAENGLAPETDDLSDDAFELLDFKKIGERFLFAEDGVIVHGGYVAQDGDLAQDVWKTLELTPRKPDYAVLVQVLGETPERDAVLALPASQAEMDAALDRVGAANWDEVSCYCFDCRIPALRNRITEADNIADAERAAECLDRLPEQELVKYKAVLAALEITELQEALDLAHGLEMFRLSPEQASYEDIALEQLRRAMGEQSAEMLRPFVSLYSYGRTLQEHHQIALTEYGGVERQDNKPLLAQEPQEQPTMGGMEMT